MVIRELGPRRDFFPSLAPPTEQQVSTTTTLTTPKKTMAATTTTTEKSPCGGGGQQCEQKQHQAHRPHARRKSLVMSLMDPSSIAANAAAAAIAIANSSSIISNNSRASLPCPSTSTTSGMTTAVMASGHISGAEIADKENHLPPGEKRQRENDRTKESSDDVDMATKSSRAHEKSATCSDTSSSPPSSCHPPPPPPASNVKAVAIPSCNKIEDEHDVRSSPPKDKNQREMGVLPTNSEGSNNEFTKNVDDQSNNSRTRTRQTMMRAAHLAMRSTWQRTAGDLTFDPSCKYCKSELVTAPDTQPQP